MFDNDINCLGCHEEEYWKVTNMPIMMMMMVMMIIELIIYNDGDQRWMMTIVKSFLLFLPLSLFSRAPLGLSINGLHIVRRKRNIFTDFWELSSLSPPWLPTLSRLELLNLKVAHPQIFHRRLSLALRSKILFRAAESCYTEPYYKLPP